MRNKTWKYLVVTSAIFVLSACGGGTKKQVNEDVSMDSVNGSGFGLCPERPWARMDAA